MTLRVTLACVALLGCAAPQSASGPDGPGPTDGPRQTFQRCTGRAYTPAPDEGWRHDIATPIITAAGDANHAGKDVLAPLASTATLSAKFSYGFVSKDLEDEDILIFVDDCAGWQPLGRRATDSDGRIALAAPALPTGVYEVRFQVAGDRSVTTAFLWMLPVGTHLAISDIDATLTTSDRAVFEQIYDGSFVPPAYPNATALTTAHAERGHVMVYLTGRPYWLAAKSRAWLDAGAFASGPLRVADSNTDTLPTEGSVGAYKRAQLAAWQAAGFVIDVAYGNATTDIYAYLGAGLAPTDVWIIGDHAGEQGTNAVTGDWGPRVAEVAAAPRIVQPFDW